jgi:ABC-type multidrug transport system ATPase subunit
MLEAEIHKQLRDFPLDLNLQVQPGEILVLMGENGAGKSTVLNGISGLLTPDT